uniref:Galectin domain-containing protein n=1 Tax=Macrostomum lignano TaxID=282301 RepID=A0A1I8GPB3_9PLAT
DVELSGRPELDVDEESEKSSNVSLSGELDANAQHGSEDLDLALEISANDNELQAAAATDSVDAGDVFEDSVVMQQASGLLESQPPAHRIQTEQVDELSIVEARKSDGEEEEPSVQLRRGPLGAAASQPSEQPHQNHKREQKKEEKKSKRRTGGLWRLFRRSKSYSLEQASAAEDKSAALRGTYRPASWVAEDSFGASASATPRNRHSSFFRARSANSSSSCEGSSSSDDSCLDEAASTASAGATAAVEDTTMPAVRNGQSRRRLPVPFKAHLPESLRSGRRIVVYGRMSDETNSTTVSLKNANSPAGQEEEFRVQITARPDEGSTVLACSQFNGNRWTAEERAKTSRFQGGNFRLEIQTTSSGFNVSFEDAVCVHPHRVPFSNFTHLILDGHTEYQGVEFPEELELPYSEEFPHSLELISSISVKLQMLKSPPTTKISFGFDRGAAMLCVIDAAAEAVSVGRTAPETGGFVCDTRVERLPRLAALNNILLKLDHSSVQIQLDGKPVVSYELPNQKQYITDFFIDGNFQLKDVSWKEKRAPKVSQLPPSFQVGRSVRVSGRLPDEAAACEVTLACGRDPAKSDIGFCLRCQPGSPITLSSSAGGRQSRPTTLARPGLAPMQQFDIGIVYKLGGFEVQLGGTEGGANLPHQIDPRRLTHLILSGGAIFYEASFPEQVGLPYFNQFPVSLRDSRFVTVRLIADLEPKRPVTLSLALCCGPADSGLKPLVCEVNLAQGFASLAWADNRGVARDEETCRFDQRLARDVETVSLEATDTEYIIAINDAAVAKYQVRHRLEDIRHVMIDGSACCVTSVEFEGKTALLFSTCN